MTNEPYRAAVIGLGMIGGSDQVSADAVGQEVAHLNGTHTEAYRKNPRIRIVAGASRDAGRRQRYEARTNAKTYADWREMIERESIDIVSIATYAPSHAEITVACANRGIPVIYCEKPAATRLGDAERMVETCKHNKVLLVFNHQRRFDLNHRRLRQAIAEGQLGELTSAHLHWGTGRLGNIGTHVLDGLLMLTGRRFQAISATLDRAGKPDCRGSDFHDPGGWGVLRLEGGLMATVNAPDHAKTPIYIEINGTKGRAFVRRFSVTLEGPSPGRQSDGRNEEWPAFADGISSMDRAVAEIVDYLDQRTPFPYAPEEAVQTLEAIVGFHASHARGSAWTDLPLSGNDREIEILSA